MSRKKRTPIAADPTPEQLARAAQQDRFLGMLAQRGNIREACEAAGCGRSTAYEWRDTDPGFAARWQDALEDACDGLETAAWVRARKQSDTLLIFLLKAHRPALYRETVNVKVLIQQETARLAAEMGVPEQDILAEFNALVGAKP